MAFRKFTGSGRGYKPIVSVTTGGKISFNGGACKKFNLKSGDYTVLFYDDERNAIGIELGVLEDAEGARPIRFRDSGADISAKPFFDYAEIDYRKETKRYDPFLEEYDGSSLVVIFLNKPIVSKSRKSDEKKLFIENE